MHAGRPEKLKQVKSRLHLKHAGLKSVCLHSRFTKTFSASSPMIQSKHIVNFCILTLILVEDDFL